MIIREKEIVNIIQSNKIQIMFLVEVDNRGLNEEEDFRTENYRTVIQKKEKLSDQTRIIALIHDSIVHSTKIREDLMDPLFPSIWIELNNTKEKNLLIGGFYREWTRNGDNSQARQVESIRIFTAQIEKAAEEEKSLLILGDANLCSEKWLEPNYINQDTAEELKSTLALCGLNIAALGKTYMADRLTEQGETISSCLDHVYFSKDLEARIKTGLIVESSSDHLPILARVQNKEKQLMKPKMITRRTMKNVTAQSWNAALIKRNWESLGETDNPSTMAELFSIRMTEALDECAPLRTFKIRPGYKQGLTETAKKMIKERDQARADLKGSPGEKKVLHEKYKKLRNRTTKQIRKDTITTNGKRIDDANDEGEVWKVINEINTPRNENNWRLVENGETVTDEKEVAEKFNHFFIDKIETLKARIDPQRVKEPLGKLKAKMEGRNLKFVLKTVTERTVRRVMDKMSKKKSKGPDGVTQELLLLGKETLVAPLTWLINSSISSGTFPEPWKEATVVPILKKGSTTEKANYRPVSCLCSASKVLEKVVCNQLTKFLEDNKLLPDNQHGFRKSRSTMTALTSIQKKWIASTEDDLKTGVLIWDLSAAFDTLDPELLCEKLGIYGLDLRSRSWFRSFLTGRTQRVKIGAKLSNPLGLTSGVPQGGILSPIVFTIYGADMEDWMSHSTLFNYADDTSSSLADRSVETIKEKLESDAEKMLCFMASNGLVANPDKTVYMMLGRKKAEIEANPLSIKVGTTIIKNSKSTRLLGVTIDEQQNWNEQFHGKGGLIPSLNKRLFSIRRVASQIPFKHRKKLVNSLWMSKLRYGLQLYSVVRMTDNDPKTNNMKVTQIAQNKMLRLLDGSAIKDRRRVGDMLAKTGLPSVNQLAAMVKLTEVWKSENMDNYPIKLVKSTETMSNREVRHGTRRQFVECAKKRVSKASFVFDAAKLWNQAPQAIKDCKTLRSAKNAIKSYCKTLPI